MEEVVCGASAYIAPELLQIRKKEIGKQILSIGGFWKERTDIGVGKKIKMVPLTRGSRASAIEGEGLRACAVLGCDPGSAQKGECGEDHSETGRPRRRRGKWSWDTDADWAEESEGGSRPLDGWAKTERGEEFLFFFFSNFSKQIFK
jgi:hypothetical protein